MALFCISKLNASKGNRNQADFSVNKNERDSINHGFLSGSRFSRCFLSHRSLALSTKHNTLQQGY